MGRLLYHDYHPGFLVWNGSATAVDVRCSMKRISGVIAILVSLSGISPAVAGQYGLLNAPVTLVAYNYIHFSTFDRFVAALDESREYGSTIKEKAPPKSGKQTPSPQAPRQH